MGVKIQEDTLVESLMNAYLAGFKDATSLLADHQRAIKTDKAARRQLRDIFTNIVKRNSIPD